MQTIQMTVTPEMAKKWLQESNKKNRNISLRRVEAYASDMKDGNWGLTHQGIAFYTDGQLADGQHRLSAVIKAKVNIVTLVTLGLPRELGIGIDHVRPRSASDAISIANESSWITKDATALANIIADFSSAKTVVSPNQTLQICNKLENEFKFVLDLFKQHKKSVSQAPVKCAFVSAYAFVNHDKLKRFSQILYSGIPKSESEEVIIYARDKILTDTCSAWAGRVNRVKLIQRAINAYDNNEKLKFLRVPNSFIYPIPCVKDIF